MSALLFDLPLVFAQERREYQLVPALRHRADRDLFTS